MLIQLCGQMGSGKSTIAQLVGQHIATVEGLPVLHIPMAAELKRQLFLMYGVYKDGLVMTPPDERNLLDVLPDGSCDRLIPVRNRLIKSEDPIECKMLARMMLEILGTDIVHTHLGVEYWCNIVFNKINAITSVIGHDVVFIVDDQRFAHEDPTGKVSTDFHTFRVEPKFDQGDLVQSTHASNMQVQTIPVHYSVYNITTTGAANHILYECGFKSKMTVR